MIEEATKVELRELLEKLATFDTEDRHFKEDVLLWHTIGLAAQGLDIMEVAQILVEWNDKYAEREHGFTLDGRQRG